MTTTARLSVWLAAAFFLTMSASAVFAQCGSASWYALYSRTASGERMNPAAMTAAHRTLPFGTWLEVTNPRNNKSVLVRVNDRGPFVRGRIIDLSKAAAVELGFVKSGVAHICLISAETDVRFPQ